MWTREEGVPPGLTGVKAWRVGCAAAWRWALCIWVKADASLHLAFVKMNEHAEERKESSSKYQKNKNIKTLANALLTSKRRTSQLRQSCCNDLDATCSLGGSQVDRTLRRNVEHAVC
jgi:hypothetical protein